MYKMALVSVAKSSNALISHEPNRYSYKKGNRFDLPYTLFDNRTESFTAFNEMRLRDKEL